MLCVITHICNDVIDEYDGNNRKQANILTKTLFDGLLYDEFHV